MEPGTRIGGYELIRSLGRGGMAEVWLARHPKMSGEYAVKFVLDQFAGNNEIMQRFGDEARRQSGLHHPNIVRFGTVVEEGGRDYIVMEYVEGSLDKKLDTLAGRPLPTGDAVNIALQLLDALEYTHTLPTGALIHRDIKPSNILLASDGSVRLTDFGIALAVNEARKTLTGQIMGTAFYMSPEQIVSPATVDLRTDIYSSGCVLYEMLTGRPPFGKDGDTDYSIQSEHINRVPDPLRRSNAHLPEAFEWVVLKALAKDPNARFKSCREMAIALLGAYRQAGLPMALLTSYHGGLTLPPGSPEALNTQPPTPPPPPPPAPDRPASRLTQLEPPQDNPFAAAPMPGWAAVPLPISGPSFGPKSTPLPGPPPAQIAPSGLVAMPPPAQIQTSGFKPVPSQPQLTSPTKPRNNTGRIILLGAAALLLIAIIGAVVYFRGNSSDVILRLEGSTSVGDQLAPALAKAYLSQLPRSSNVEVTSKKSKAADGTDFTLLTVSGQIDGKQQQIEIVSNGSGNAFTALSKGSTDLGMASRPYGGSDPTDMSYLTSSPSFEHVIALDGIAVITNPGNRLSGLTMTQLKSIFTGATTDWSQVGGNGGRIHCYGRVKTSGTFQMFRDAVVGSKGKLTAIDSSSEFAEGKEVVDHVTSDPNGIGYVTFTQTAGARAVPLSDNGTQTLVATPLTVSTEDYLMTRRLYLYEPRAASEKVKDFIEFVQHDQGQDVVSKLNFVPLIPSPQTVPIPPDAPADYRAAVAGLQNLGLSFRFKSGQGNVKGSNYVLDNLAEDNIRRLQTYVQDHRGAQLTLVGFTDNVGAEARNKQLSLDRAGNVAGALDPLGIQAKIVGLGAEMPVATNTTDLGKAKNRRVEVWVSGGGR